MATGTGSKPFEGGCIELKKINLRGKDKSQHLTSQTIDDSKIYRCVHCKSRTKLDELKDIIKAGKSKINYTDENKRTALHVAVQKDEVETVKLLIDAGASLEFNDTRGNTALHDVYDRKYPQSNSAEIFKILFPIGKNNESLRENIVRDNVQQCTNHPKNRHVQAWFATSINSNGQNVLDLILQEEKLSEDKRKIVRLLINEIDTFHLMRLFRNTPRSPYDINSEIGKPLKSDDKNEISSTFRRLIHIFPEVIPDLMNRCITQSTGKVNYHFELLDDVFLLHTWPPKQEHYDKWLNQNLWEHIDEKEEREAYSVQLSTIRNNHPLMLMIKHKNDKGSRDKKEVYKQMVDHPLVRVWIRYKWLHIGRNFHIFSSFLYLIFLITLTTFVITIDPLLTNDPLSDNTSITANANSCIYSTICNTTYICQNSSVCQSTTSCYNTSTFNVSTTQNASDDVPCEIFRDYPGIIALRAMLVCLVVIFILKEFYHIIMMYGLEYFKVLQNYITWTSYGTLIVFLINTSDCEDTAYRTKLQWTFGSIAIFLAWVDSLTYVEKFEKIGIYVSMLKRITITFLRNVFPIVVILLTAFALAFFCVRNNQDKFKDILISLLSTAALMADGFEYDDVSTDSFDGIAFVTVLTSSLFLVIMTIIIMNLMIGVAVSDVQKVYDEAIEKHSDLQIEHILGLELICHAFLKILMVFKCTRECTKRLRAKFIQDPNKSVLLGRTQSTKLPKERNHDNELENICKRLEQLDELTSLKSDLSRIENLLKSSPRP